jgi:hypothetical protein
VSKVVVVFHEGGAGCWKRQSVKELRAEARRLTQFAALLDQFLLGLEVLVDQVGGNEPAKLLSIVGGCAQRALRDSGHNSGAKTYPRIQIEAA